MMCLKSCFDDLLLLFTGVVAMTEMYLGCFDLGQSESSCFTGQLDDFMLYATFINQSTVQSLSGMTCVGCGPSDVCVDAM